MNDDRKPLATHRVNARSSTDLKRTPSGPAGGPAGETRRDYRRIFCGILAIVSGFSAISLGFLGFVSPNTASWALGTFGKVAFLLAFVWLAWPQLIWISELPGGGIAMIALAAGGMFFILRPRAMLYVMPAIVGTMLLFIAIGFVQRYLLPPK